MSKISLIAKLTCAEGKNADFEAALGDMITASNEEAGLEIYSAHRVNDSDTYFFFELYTDGEALAVHGKGDGMKSAMKAIGAFIGGKPEVSVMTPIVAKGLDI